MSSKDLEELFTGLLTSIFIMIKNIFIGAFRGAKRLKERKFLIAALITFVPPYILISRYDMSVLRYFKGNNPRIDFIIFWFLSLIIYLNIISVIGMREGKELMQRLEDYKFYGVDGKLPVFLGKENDVDFGLEVLKFKAAIPLKTWKSSREDLESLFNRTIVSINQDSSKDRVLLKTIPGSVEIPQRIEWKDDYMRNKDGVVVIGQNAVREISFDLNKTPHVLSAGETGSGKSVILRLMLWQLLNAGCRAYMIDFKGGVGARRWFEISSEMVIGIA